MKIMITGSSGQLGSECVALLSREHEVIATTRAELDVTNLECIRAAMDTHRPDALVNCAAYTAVDRAEAESGLCHTINATAPGLLGQACAEHGTRIVHISTDYVFDGERDPPATYKETDTTNPRSVYGRSKLEGEIALMASGAQAAVLRTAWLYGANGGNFPKTMLRLALARPDAVIRVVNDQWGTPTEASRLAAQIQCVLEAPAFPAGILHATSEGFASWLEFAGEFLRAMDVPHNLAPCPTSEYPTAAMRPRCAILENAALKEINLNRMRDWRADLRDFAQRNRGSLLAEAAGTGS